MMGGSGSGEVALAVMIKSQMPTSSSVLSDSPEKTPIRVAYCSFTAESTGAISTSETAFPDLLMVGVSGLMAR